MGTSHDRKAERMKITTILSAGGLALALLVSPSMAVSAFKLESSSKAAEVDPEPSPAFDRSEYEVWVDHTYTAVVEYGRAGHIAKAPSYGDKMLLEDALKLLLPENWQVMRSTELASEGRIHVTWDVAQANWVDVLENLGERHGLRFHIDHANLEVFLQNGRQLIFDRPVAGKGDGDESVKGASSAESENAKADVVEPEDRGSVLFTISEGDRAEQSLNDLALLLGFEKTYWMMGSKRAEHGQTLEGSRMAVLSKAAKQFGGKVCLYEGEKVAAFVSKSQECPK
jgi:hypothetical protein